nr:calcium-binding protein [Geitlerinema sp. P-1104]
MGAAGVETLSEDGQRFVSSEVQQIIGQGGDDTIESALNATEPGSTLFGNAGNDYIRSRGVGDRVFGGQGNDTIVSDVGQAIIYGDLGDDYLVARDTRTTLFGGRSFGEATAQEGKNILLSFGGKNILKGGGGDDSLVGEEGADTMAGNSGNDTIMSGPRGASYLFGNKGEDYLLSRATDNPDTLFGGQGNDKVVVDANSSANAPLLFGGVGDDSLIIAGSTGQVDGAILVGDVQPDGTFGGSDGDEGNNYLLAESGKNHQLFGNSGNDTLKVGVNIGVGVSLFGGRGDDVLLGGTNADSAVTGMKAYGDKGNDTLIFVGSDSEFWGDNPNITTGFGNNFIQITGKSNVLRGGNKNSTGTDSGDNQIIAIAPELAEGEETNNTLWGGAGDDTINAGSSGPGDVLIGGPNGGEGNNTYIFGNNQTIELDTIGLNTYFGVNALETTVTVRPTDQIGGESNFVVTGDQSGVHQIEAGGVKTGAGNDFISIGEATGQTNAGDGSDTLALGNVGGTDADAIPNTVSGGAGNDVININGTDGVRANAVVDGGAGDDTIQMTDDRAIVFGKVLGGDGNDIINVKSVGTDGLVDGGAGDDVITATTVFGGGKIIGGEGNDEITVGVALNGAFFDGGPGNDKIIISGLGSDAENTEPISIQGGAGNDILGLSTDDPTLIGNAPVKMQISSTSGRNILQGGFFSDTITGGADRDIIYGGARKIEGEKYNNFNFAGLNLTGTDSRTVLAEDGLAKFAGGNRLTGGAGGDAFIFRTKSETALELQGILGADEVGLGTAGNDNVLPGDVATGNLLVGTNGQFLTSASGTGLFETGTGFFSGAIGVDTLTDFARGQDSIVLDLEGDLSAFFANAGVRGTGAFGANITLFKGAEASLGVIGSAPSSSAFGTSFFEDVQNNSSQGSLAYGDDSSGSITVDYAPIVGKGSISFDVLSNDLYIGNGNEAVLFAHAPNLSLTGSTIANDFVFAENFTVGFGDQLNIF